MTDAEKLLILIKSARKNQTKKLDEIDARFFAYIFPSAIPEWWKEKDGSIGKHVIKHLIRFNIAPKYSRSRDVLKAVRPKEVISFLMVTNDLEDWSCGLTVGMVTHTGGGSTEELAELYSNVVYREYKKGEG